MSASTDVLVRSDAGMSRRERAGRAIMWLAVLAAAGAAGTALLSVLDAGSATKVAETWRLCGLVVFTGLFLLLALHPHHYRGVWELVIASKLALVVAAAGYAAHGGITGTGTIIGWDGGLTIALIAAYICCRGWTATPHLRSRKPVGQQDDHPGRSSSRARRTWCLPGKSRSRRFARTTFRPLRGSRTWVTCPPAGSSAVHTGPPGRAHCRPRADPGTAGGARRRMRSSRT